MLIDSHCHLFMSDFDSDRPEVLARARGAGVATSIAVGPPTPHRGRRNEPAFLCLMADQLTNLWGTGPSHVAEVTTRNVRRAFGLPSPGDGA